MHDIDLTRQHLLSLRALLVHPATDLTHMEWCEIGSSLCGLVNEAVKGKERTRPQERRFDRRSDRQDGGAARG